MCSYTEKEWRRDISVHARKHDLEMKVGFNDKNNDLDYIWASTVILSITITQLLINYP